MGLKAVLNLAMFGAITWAAFPEVSAQPAVRHGFERDERGRVYQTSFDLRRRFATGVAWAPEVDGGLGGGASLHLGGIYERTRSNQSRRTRIRYLEGRILLDDLAIDATLLEVGKGRRTDEPAFWLTTFIGKPRRFDVNVDIAPGFVIGRLTIDDTAHVRGGIVDVVQGHIDWGIYQGTNLENYLILRAGVGTGVRFSPPDDASTAHVYPEIALRGSWLFGARGLTQLNTEARGRVGRDLGGGGLWREARGTIELERIVLAVSDQPLSIFLAPEARYFSIVDGVEGLDLRAQAGVRLSLFAPPRDEDAI